MEKIRDEDDTNPECRKCTHGRRPQEEKKAITPLSDFIESMEPSEF